MYVCVFAHTCVCLSPCIFVSMYEPIWLCVYNSGDTGLTSVTQACTLSDSGPVLCRGRKGLKPFLEQRQHISTPGSKSLNIKAFKSGLNDSHIYSLGPFLIQVLFNDHNLTERKHRLELMVSVKVEQFPLNSFNISLAINHPL